MGLPDETDLGLVGRARQNGDTDLMVRVSTHYIHGLER